MKTTLNSNPAQSTFFAETSMGQTSHDMEIPPLLPLASSTMKSYRVIYERCQRRAMTKRQSYPEQDVIITPADLVDEWMESLSSINAMTANTYRSAILRMFQEEQPAGWEDAFHRLRDHKQLSRSVQQRLGTSSDRRTRQPRRMIPQEDWTILINQLTNMGRAGARAQWWLVAGIASGARSVEWPNAEWIDGSQTVLRIYSAKVKSRNAWYKIPPMTFTAEDIDDEVGQLWGGERFARGSAHSISYYDVDFARRLAGISLTPEESVELKKNQYKNGVLLFRDILIEPQSRMIVRIHMEEVARILADQKTKDEAKGRPARTAEEIFTDACFNPVRNTIYRACKRAFDDKLYSLADTRSTFSANRKAAMGLASASADLGHASITTSRDFYAPASKAWAKYLPPSKPRTTLPAPADGMKPSIGM